MASKTKRRSAWAPFFTQEAKIIHTVFLSYNSRLISHKAINVLLLQLYNAIYPGGRVIWVNFCWVCAAGLSEPIPHYSLRCGDINDSILVTLEKSNFRNPNLGTFCFYIYLKKPLNFT